MVVADVEASEVIQRKSVPVQNSSRPVSSEAVDEEEHISKAELRLTDIAEALMADWSSLAKQLGLSPGEIESIESDFDIDAERALVALHLWVQSSGPIGHATGNDLEKALKVIGRDDVIRRCMYNIKEVTDSAEKAVARGYLDTNYDQLRDEIGLTVILGLPAHHRFNIHIVIMSHHSFQSRR